MDRDWKTEDCRASFLLFYNKRQTKTYISNTLCAGTKAQLCARAGASPNTVRLPAGHPQRR